MRLPSTLSKTSRQAADVTAETSIRYTGQEKRSSRSKIHLTTREKIEPIQDISDDKKSNHTSKLARVEEARVRSKFRKFV